MAQEINIYSMYICVCVGVSIYVSVYTVYTAYKLIFYNI